MDIENSFVTVAVRVRPTSVNNGTTSVEPFGSSAIVQKRYDKHKFAVTYKKYNFDFVHWSTHSPLDTIYASQQTIHDDVGEPLVEHVLKGNNACVLAYGSTGSGKSFTLFGHEDASGDLVGLMPRMCRNLLSSTKRHESTVCKTSFKVSFVEIYNEKVFDLLLPTVKGVSRKGVDNCREYFCRKALKVREDPVNGPFVEGATEKSVTCYEDVSHFLKHGLTNRKSAATKFNCSSSRSHAIFTIVVVKSLKYCGGIMATPGCSDTSVKLNFVDLAGSENLKQTGTDEAMRQESIHINKSLLTLRRVIAMLNHAPPSPQSDVSAEIDGNGSNEPCLDCEGTPTAQVVDENVDFNINRAPLAMRTPFTASHWKAIDLLRTAITPRDEDFGSFLSPDLLTQSPDLMLTESPELLSASPDFRTPGGFGSNKMDRSAMMSKSLGSATDLLKLAVERRASRVFRCTPHPRKGTTAHHQPLTPDLLKTTPSPDRPPGLPVRTQTSACCPHHLGPDSSGARIPFRDSVLTHLLRDSLRGPSRTFIIATIDPSEGCAEETANTLDFAARAQGVLSAQVSERTEISAVKALRVEVQTLREALTAAASHRSLSVRDAAQQYDSDDVYEYSPSVSSCRSSDSSVRGPEPQNLLYEQRGLTPLGLTLTEPMSAQATATRLTYVCHGDDLPQPQTLFRDPSQDADSEQLLEEYKTVLCSLIDLNQCEVAIRETVLAIDRIETTRLLRQRRSS